MCGIAGFVQLNGNSFLPQMLVEASGLLAHRGPDDEGFAFFDAAFSKTIAYGSAFPKPMGFPEAVSVGDLLPTTPFIGLAHRRLSIIDPLPEGHQPFTSRDGQVTLSFNGEIYNYKSLRSELKGYGYRFETETDTEVLLYAWVHWGADCQHRLDGMWSFAVVDLTRRIFFASTDPAGIKPFYYAGLHGSSGFCFASEIKAFKAFHIPFSEDQKVVSRFLLFGKSDESNATFFTGIFRLQGGCQLCIGLDDQTVQIQPYLKHRYSHGFDFQPQILENERVESIRELLIEMIGLRLQADVPLGVCLSGGIDSSTIAGLMHFADKVHHNHAPRKAFMATLPAGSHGDESAFARLMANTTGFQLITTQPNAQDFTDALTDLAYTLDEPAPGLNAFSQFAVFKAVKANGITVTLDGQGADEVFAGYPRHHEMLLAEGVWHGALPWDSLPYAKPAATNAIRHIVGQSLGSAFLKYQKPEYEIFNRNVFDFAGSKGNFHTDLNEGLAQEFTSDSLPFLLKAADRNSMRWSVESRMPFADFQPLIRYLFAMPGSAKIQAGYSKYLLRKAAAPFVPAPILNRRDKVGFAAPNHLWMQAIPPDLWDFVLASPPGNVDTKKIRHWVASPGTADPLVLWRAFAYLLWRKIFGL